MTSTQIELNDITVTVEPLIQIDRDDVGSRRVFIHAARWDGPNVSERPDVWDRVSDRSGLPRGRSTLYLLGGERDR